jgi:hypothetical protein
MENPMIPRLYCPFSSCINPFAATVHTHTFHWAQRFQLYAGAYKTFTEENITGMTARFYPTADKHHLCLANDLFVLLFAGDGFVNRLLSVIYDPAEGLAAVSGKAAAFRDIWWRLKQISSPAWQRYFATNLEKYGTIARISTDLITVIENIVLPAAILEHPSIAELSSLACSALHRAQDLFSLGGAGRAEDNTVLSACRQKQLSLPEAIQFSAYIHDNEVIRFTRMAAELPSFGAHDADLRRYVYILGAILKGNIDWSVAETSRYTFRYAGGMIEKP